MTPPQTTLFWFRRDLRLGDNPALSEAIARAREDGGDLLPAFVWEPRERRRWAPGAAGRWWLWNSLVALDGELRRLGSRLALGRGDPAVTLPELARAASAGTVVWAAGLEPDERAEDDAVAATLAGSGVEAVVVPSANLLFDPDAIRTREGRPYTVFTPYWRACLSEPAPVAPLAAPEALPAGAGGAGRPRARRARGRGTEGVGRRVRRGLAAGRGRRPTGLGAAPARTPRRVRR